VRPLFARLWRRSRGWGLGGLFPQVLSRCHGFRDQTTAAASLDSGSDSALTASDNSLISA
jgi:hypothetical protein